ncbi:hypothetical protein [Sulfurisphaera tokodaii]|uniref:Uncharacterized protein n=2 Tax=Sulfurisphaera tokodaii TaxID=111955 RepID=Q970I0_SULTO|nr:hypothetical protein [Sulfurisphaera tokodaii]BAB66693.1 hypothetical protein STK_16150 [Sulfurisphaera tokodaii str. 7]HII73485.1 hypothetical protein [Sulfurisphaera tokodaii]
MKYLAILLLLIGFLGIIAYSQSSLIAKPLYLSIYSTFTVFNVVNTSYNGITNISNSIYYVISNSWIKIVIVNFTTQQQVATLTAYFTTSDAKWIYYDPTLGSVIFLVNVSSDKPINVAVTTLNIPGPLYNVSGTPVSEVTIIPLGYLTLANGTPVNETAVFVNYLNGTAVVKSMIDGLAGYYVLYYVT